MVGGIVLLAAGKATRYKDKKQDILFHGKTLWKYVYETALQVVDAKHIIVVGKDVKGGETRAESVWNGLKAIPDDTERVVILEAARPMITKKQIETLLYDDCESASFVWPLVQVVIFRNAEKYLNRDDLYQLVTPQAFDYKMLLKAYESGRFLNSAEETQAFYEFYGIKPHLIEAETNLFKVTYPGDLAILESIYETMNGKKM